MIKKEFTCQKQDKVLNIVSKNEISYSNANKLLRKKDIRVDNVKINENIVVYPGQKITVFMPEEFLMDEKKFFEIVYEDENILIINKQKGIEVTSPFENSIEKILLKEKKVFPLNRLDRNTEGLVIFGKTKDFFEKLKKAMKNGEIEKYYLLEVVGTPNFENKNIVSFLQKDEEKSEVKIFDSPRKDSVKIETNLSVVNRSSGGTSVLIAEIHNGKTHQIRAQLAHIGYPIVGDGKYGKNTDNKKFKSKTQKLTAFKLVFNFKDKDLKYLNNLNFEIKPTWLN
ncbi:MAG: RluA family pseudouridine synthase [Firmicutes bacterium]|nr:RluA family pseudouridine synthase [Bacillota bacterium]MDY3658981.1 RluA family pseudouridine synthase [Eubacteriales bacterium]